ncbi:FtsX-like permease family protein [Streptomyces sp. NPDC059002]|uniref:FtsX-like permease family protein n=1 Tax=Streptomyces sp. NPDC059002 TaxID=3346690 RepID=UPI0036D197C4
MLSVALSTLRVRWVSFVGTFVALTFGVGLMATAIPVIAATGGVADAARQRYSEAPVVVVPHATVDVADKNGRTQSTALPQQPGLGADLVAAVARTGKVVADHSFSAQLAGGPKDQVGRGWSAHAAGGYRLAAGRAPAEDGEVVIGGGAASLIGRSLPLTTAAGPRKVTVTGVTDVAPFEHAVFFTDAEAARLSPAVDALAAYGPADAVRKAVAAVPGAEAAVLTGKDRAHADPHHAALLAEMDGVSTPLGLAAGVAGFVAVFVVAGTFALSVAQRRRELALLRLVGSTRRQLRRLICCEAVLVGLLASAAGCALGLAGVPLCRAWLVGHGIVSDGFTAPVTWRALLAAAGIGMVTAMAGVAVSAVRAGLVSPGDALREAAVERRPRAGLVLRWVAGGTALTAGVVAVTGTAAIQPQAGANAAASASVVLVIVAACTTLAGVLAGPLVRLLTALPLALSARRDPDAAEPGGVVWTTARQSALTAFRRTSATTTPVVIVIALAGCLLGTLDTINAAQVSGVRKQLSRTDYVVSPAGTPGLSEAVVRRVRSVPGTTTLVTTPTTVLAARGPRPAVARNAAAVDPAALATVAALKVDSGSLTDLGPDSVVVSASWPGSPATGDRIKLWLADGTPKNLTVAAVLAPDHNSVRAYLDASLTPHFGTTLASRADVRLAPGTDREHTAEALRTAVHGLGAKISTPDEVSAAATDANTEASRNGILMILGLSVLYALTALANTLLMTTTDRRRELTLLRLAGATKTQVLRSVATETLLCVAAGTLLGTFATALSITGSWSALHQLVGPTPAMVPWNTLTELLTACTAIALAATLTPTALALRGGKSG